MHTGKNSSESFSRTLGDRLAVSDRLPSQALGQSKSVTSVLRGNRVAPVGALETSLLLHPLRSCRTLRAAPMLAPPNLCTPGMLAAMALRAQLRAVWRFRLNARSAPLTQHVRRSPPTADR